MDASPKPQGPLSDRPTNTHLNQTQTQQTNDKIEDLKAAPANMSSLDYHRQVLQGKLENGEKYVSRLYFV